MEQKENMRQIILKKGREKALKLKHQWLFSGSIDRVTSDDGDSDYSSELLQVVDYQGNFLAYASYNPNSKIAARIWSFDEDENVFSHEFFDERIEKALNLRMALNFECCENRGFRIINSEGDFLPGVIADFYDNMVVVQFLTKAADSYKELISQIPLEKTGAVGVYERSDADVRSLEKLPPSAGLLAGKMPDKELIINENGAKFHIDIVKGHKSGFYLDQAASRKIISEISADKTVLNCFSYTGGFGVAALLGGAKTVTNVDRSKTVLEIAEKNMQLNGFSEDSYENICGDVFSLLRKFRAEKRKFDLIILDPPKLVDSRKNLNKAAKAYKDMALVAFQILNENGLLANFSCSGLMDRDLFQKITFDAAIDAGVNAKLVRRFEQNCDHTVALSVPEGFYLKGHLISI
ncbi:MAG: class I SAM-dependent rRNA methyltransferase [Lentisphaeria bacterium]|nr:class I SAM-dependent rRNA methyltransferase [Lentisphaeria bacterium]